MSFVNEKDVRKILQIINHDDGFGELCGFVNEEGKLCIDTFGPPSNPKIAYTFLPPCDERNIYELLVLPLSGRKSCQHSHYRAYIWHIHPKNAKIYPSVEDLEKVFKKNVVKRSLIFTKDGMWDIRSEKFSFDQITSELNQSLRRYGDDLYRQLNRGRVYNKHYIQEYCDKIKALIPSCFEFQIKFIPF